LRIVVSGLIGGVPNQGGLTWMVLQYVLGLKRLGHDVCFIETLPAAAEQPKDPDPIYSDSARYFSEVMQRFCLEDQAALLHSDSGEAIGMTRARVTEVCRSADLLLNHGGILRDPRLLEHIPTRVYVDLDPGFTQLWQAVQGIDMGFSLHTHFVTIGEAIGKRRTRVPDCGLDWITTPQPIVLGQWPVARAIERDSLTTVANWRGYGSVEFEGQFYGQKVHSWRSFFELPRRTKERFEVALSIHQDEKPDIEALAANGWYLLDPTAVAAMPGDYQRFVQGSKAEFGLAKLGYVAGRTGWFSDRSICYLASGRPVMAQETGFSEHLPTGTGLFSFESLDDVLGAIDSMNANYPLHAKAARGIAEAYFDSDRVLDRLLQRIEETPCKGP
jgi:hypothetical protein